MDATLRWNTSRYVHSDDWSPNTKLEGLRAQFAAEIHTENSIQTTEDGTEVFVNSQGAEIIQELAKMEKDMEEMKREMADMNRHLRRLEPLEDVSRRITRRAFESFLREPEGGEEWRIIQERKHSRT